MLTCSLGFDGDVCFVGESDVFGEVVLCFIVLDATMLGAGVHTGSRRTGGSVSLGSGVGGAFSTTFFFLDFGLGVFFGVAFGAGVFEIGHPPPGHAEDLLRLCACRDR